MKQKRNCREYTLLYMNGKHARKPRTARRPKPLAETTAVSKPLKPPGGFTETGDESELLKPPDGAETARYPKPPETAGFIIETAAVSNH